MERLSCFLESVDGASGQCRVGAPPGGEVHCLLSRASPDRESDVHNGGGIGGGGDGDEMIDKSERREQLCDDGSPERGEKGRGGIDVPGPTPADPPASDVVGGSELMGEEFGVWIEGQLAPVLTPLTGIRVRVSIWILSRILFKIN